MTKITDPNKLAELQDKRLELANSMKSYHTEHEKTWTAENEAAWKTINDEYDAVHAPLDAHQKACDAEAKSESAAQARADRLVKIGEHGTRFTNSQENKLKGFGGDQFRNLNFGSATLANGKISGGILNGLSMGAVGALAFAAWLGGRGDEAAVEACTLLNFNPNAREINVRLLDTGEYLPVQNAVRDRKTGDIQNSLSTAIGTAGGYTFGPTFVNQLELAMTSASGMMETAQIIRTESGEEMRWPTADDTSNEGSQVGESGTVDDSVEPTFGQKLWYAHKFKSGMIKVPTELLDDNAVNLETVIPQMLGARIGRIINRKATVGTGAATMNGIVVASTNGKTAASATAIVFDEIIDLEHSVNRAIRADHNACGYMMNDLTLKALRKLKDTTNRYLWQSGANTGVPDMLNTYRYTINDHMEDIASGIKSVLFGRLSSYKLRIVRTIRLRRLEERYADTDEVAFVAFLRADGNLLDPGDHPVKALTQA